MQVHNSMQSTTPESIQGILEDQLIAIHSKKMLQAPAGTTVNSPQM
jgi:hypothetical protein